MHPHFPKRTIVALVSLIVAGAVLLMLGSRGDDGSDALSATPATTPSSVLPSAPSTLPGSTTPPTTAEPTTGKSPAVPAVLSIAIDYSCDDGSNGSAEVPTGDLELIDDTVNTIDLCEFRGGLAEISFVASCPSGDRPVTVPATDGGLPDLATLDLCETAA